MCLYDTKVAHMDARIQYQVGDAREMERNRALDR